MKILMVAPEMVPFSKVGGLADVVGALPIALSKMGHDVKVICPRYSFMKLDSKWSPMEKVFQIYLGREVQFGRLWQRTLDDGKTEVYALENDTHFDIPTVYTHDYALHEQEGYRFAFLSRAAIDFCFFLDWIPDIIHCHDWTTGLVSVHLSTRESETALAKTASVFTIHNLQFQGVFSSDLLAFSGLPMNLFKADGLESYGRVNSMKGAIYHSQKVTTVSENYAREIQTPEFGFGLQATLKYKASDLIGVVNGIDIDMWDPQTDKKIPQAYSSTQMAGKAIAKAEFQAKMGLEVDPEIPLFTVISRLFHQKGLDVLMHAVPKILDNMEVQFAVIGTGEPELERGFADLNGKYPGRFSAFIGYHDELAHLLYAGGDFIVIPSRFEPCGLSQMYGMRYGNLPIARATGGLVDTIDQYNESTAEGTGFLFDHLNVDAIYYTIGWACSTYYDRKDHLVQLQKNAMARDFSWDKSGIRYEAIYHWAYEAKNGYVYEQPKPAAPVSTKAALKKVRG